MSREAEVVVAAEALLGEGPVWDAESARLLWVDIWRHELHRYDPATGTDTTQTFPGEIAAVAPVHGGGLLAAVGSEVMYLAQPYAAGGAGGDGAPPRRLAVLPTGIRANDGKCDPAGRFLIGTLAPEQPGTCALYRIEGQDRIGTVIPGVTLSNGLDWSPDGRTLYFVDTPTCAVDVLDYDPDTGRATGRRQFADLGDAPGRPDGLTVDSEGGVWVAVARAGQVRRYDTAGRLDEVIELPAPRVTSCAFGGPALDELYVTSGRFDMRDEEITQAPLSGALFRIRPGVTGKPAHLAVAPV